MELADLKREHECIERGDLRDREGQYEKAIKAYDNALKIDPENADVLFDKGETLVKMGRLKEAQKCFDLAFKYYTGE